MQPVYQPTARRASGFFLLNSLPCFVLRLRGLGKQLGYVGFRLDPPGMTELWGAAVVPMW